MPSKKVEKIAKDIKELPPPGVAAVKIAMARTPEEKEAALKEGEAVLDAENPNWRTDNMVGKIRTFDQDALSFRQRIKTLKEQIQEEVERAPEYTRVQDIINELKDARADLKRRLERNSTYMGLLQELADERLALTDAERNMSDFLKGYYADTREEQIELTPEDTRMVVIRAKLGKPQDFQTNLFSRVADTEE